MSTPSGPPPDPIIGYIIGDTLVVPREGSALTYGDMGIVMPCIGDFCGNAGILTPDIPAIALPWTGVLLAGAVGALAMIKRKQGR